MTVLSATVLAPAMFSGLVVMRCLATTPLLSPAAAARLLAPPVQVTRAFGRLLATVMRLLMLVRSVLGVSHRRVLREGEKVCKGTVPCVAALTLSMRACVAGAYKDFSRVGKST